MSKQLLNENRSRSFIYQWVAKLCRSICILQGFWYRHFLLKGALLKSNIKTFLGVFATVALFSACGQPKVKAPEVKKLTPPEFNNGGNLSLTSFDLKGTRSTAAWWSSTPLFGLKALRIFSKLRTIITWRALLGTVTSVVLKNQKSLHGALPFHKNKQNWRRCSCKAMHTYWSCA